MSDLLPSLVGFLAGFVLAAAILSVRTRRLRRDLRENDRELAAARDGVRQLQQELAAARRQPVADEAAILADNADLRRRMDELADAILTQGRHPPPA